MTTIVQHKTLGMAAALVACLACQTVEGSGNVVTEKREIADFDRVALKDRGSIYYTQSSEVGLLIEADDNIVDEFRTSVEGGKLVIEQRRDVWLDPSEPIRFHLSGPEMLGVELDGRGSFLSERIETPSLTVAVDGSGKVELDAVFADTLQVEVDGSADLTLAGKVITQKIDVDGIADYHARNLESAHCIIDVGGSADATLFVTDDLTAHIDGNGDVYYRGNPQVKSDIDGSGKLSAIE